jgi:hypothetical protein
MSGELGQIFFLLFTPSGSGAYPTLYAMAAKECFLWTLTSICVMLVENMFSCTLTDGLMLL